MSTAPSGVDTQILSVLTKHTDVSCNREKVELCLTEGEAMIVRRETQTDRTKEHKLLEAMAGHLECNFKQNPNTHKYSIDGWFYSKTENPAKGLMLGWAECKWYTGKAHCFLNVAKYSELMNLSLHSGLPSYFIVREPGRWGYINLTYELGTMCVHEGGTPAGREPNEDDIEPLIKLDSDSIRWML